MLQGKPKEAENTREEVMPTPNKAKFRGNDTEDNESSYGSTEEMAEKMDLGTILIDTIPISLKCSTIFLTFLDLFKSKEMEESLVEIEKEHSLAEQKYSQRVITIDSFEGSKA